HPRAVLAHGDSESPRDVGCDPLPVTDNPKFSPGDHLRVRRGLYYHHGIYVGNNQVVQFGGRIGDKAHAKIAVVPFACFLRGDRAEVVDQSKLTWLGLWKLPPALPPERIVARARCLAERQSEGAYNLVGRNCE